jgi:arsenate reductase
MLVVYGIPNCDTVRKARIWMDARGIEHTFVNVRKVPLKHADVARWVGQLGSKPMRNTSGGAYRALPEDKKQWSDQQWAAAIAEQPMLLKRPLIVQDGTALLAGFRGTDEAISAALGV